MKAPHRIVAGALWLALAGVALILAGCGKSVSATSSVAPAAGTSTGATSSSASSAIDALARDLQAADSVAHGPCMPFGLPVGIPHGCAFDETIVSFLCTDTHDGLTDTHGYQFLDAGGTPQAAYDSITTASIRFHALVSGTSTRGPSSTVEDERSLVETGLAGDETSRVWNGNGTSSRQDSVRALDGSLRLVHRQSTTAVVGVVVPKPWARDSWPTRGTITTHLVETGGLQDRDLTSVLTFNGTRYATLAVGGSTFTVDLAAPGPCGPGGGLPPPPGGGPGSGPPPPPGGGPGGGLPPPPPGGGR